MPRQRTTVPRMTRGDAKVAAVIAGDSLMRRTTATNSGPPIDRGHDADLHLARRKDQPARDVAEDQHDRARAAPSTRSASAGPPRTRRAPRAARRARGTRSVPRSATATPQSSVTAAMVATRVTPSRVPSARAASSPSATAFSDCAANAASTSAGDEERQRARSAPSASRARERADDPEAVGVERLAGS